MFSLVVQTQMGQDYMNDDFQVLGDRLDGQILAVFSVMSGLLDKTYNRFRPDAY